MGQRTKGLSLTQGALRLCSQAQMPAAMLPDTSPALQMRKDCKGGSLWRENKAFPKQYK